MKLSPTQLTELLSIYIPQRFPVLITGRPGIGKSDIVEAAAAATDHELLISHPVVEDPTDSKGLPFPSSDGERARFLPFGDLERAFADMWRARCEAHTPPSIGAADSGG